MITNDSQCAGCQVTHFLPHPVCDASNTSRVNTAYPHGSGPHRANRNQGPAKPHGAPVPVKALKICVY